MLDIGLLVTGVLMWLTVAAAARWAPVSVLAPREVLDRLLVPSLTGILFGRLVAVLLDDPDSLRSLRALLVISGGVEFWPGTAAAVGVLAWGLRRARLDVALGLATLAPFLLWGYATYEAACLVRDGCYGPVSAAGFVPDGLQTRMFPVGLMLAAAVTALGFAVRHLWAWSPAAKILLAVAGVAAGRSMASVWLPRLGDGLTRPHTQSIAVLVVTVVVGLGLALRSGRSRSPTRSFDGGERHTTAPPGPRVDGADSS